MSEPLTGAAADDAREIAQQEVASFVRLLLEELGWSPRQHRRLIAAVANAHRRFNEGEVLL